MKKNLMVTSVLLLLLACVSCSFMSGTSSNKPSSVELTRSDLERLGVNMDHIFIFSDTIATYNGKPFQMGMTIGELCEIFGKYDRKFRNYGYIFVWDSIGVTMTTLEGELSETNKVNGLIIDWNIDLRVLGEEDPELRERCPRKYFTGNIIVGGAALGRGMQVKDFFKRTSLEFPPGLFPILHYCKLNDWDYRKTELFRIEYFTYLIRESKSQDNIETFNMAISTRERLYKDTQLLDSTYHKDYPNRFDHTDYYTAQ